MTEALASKTCTPCRGGVPPLTREEAEIFHVQAPEWQLPEEAHHIERSFNTLAKAPVDGDVRALLEELLHRVTDAGKSLPAERAQQMARDAEALTAEASSKQPRRQWYELSLKGLKEAAVAVGEVGKPILETVGKLLPLLVGL